MEQVAEVAEGVHVPNYGALLVVEGSGEMLMADVEELVPATADLAGGGVGDAAHVVTHEDPVAGHRLGLYLDLKGVQKVDPTVR